MAVEFISNGYDTTSTNPYTEGAWANAHPSIGSATYGVRSATHWKVSVVANSDRTVSIAAGQGFGHGVTDKTYEAETIQLDTITSGSRWDLIAVRRDWTPTAGVSKFVKVNGGATAVVPGGRLYGPGNIDDQPIALVQVTAGKTWPTDIIDLRTWSGDGAGIWAREDLVRSFLNAVGTRLHINGVDWIRRVGANDTPEWVSPTPRSGEVFITTTGFSTGRIVFDRPFADSCKSAVLTNSTPALNAVIFKVTAKTTTYLDFVAYNGSGAGLSNSGLYVNYIAEGI